jgi:hypothetical protein
VPYVYGGTDPKKGLDCSGLTQLVFRQVGISLPRTSQEQARSGIGISSSDLSPGDLILSDWGDGPNSHVAIYAGNGKLIESPRTGENVRIAAFDSNYRGHANGYRRVTSKKTGVISLVQAISGVSGSADVQGGSGGGGLLDWPTGLLSFFSEGTDAMTNTVKFFGAFFQPSTYVRLGAGLLGTVCVLGGLVFLVKGAAE